MDLKSFQLHFTLNSTIYTLIIGLIVWKISRILRGIHHFRHFEQERVFRAQLAVGLGVSCDIRESAPFSRPLRYDYILSFQIYNSSRLLMFPKLLYHFFIFFFLKNQTLTFGTKFIFGCWVNGMHSWGEIQENNLLVVTISNL